ncbi:MAG: aminotransferase class I/II-fold pyridoxal phosphate-dependent enzyme [Candidatus Omnitrophica bacterium]|nr:aminotransferase class I/II-fold pyridoxal phosphate-dependent enzyme [Candidatus Omnitrophota bacterium]
MDNIIFKHGGIDVGKRRGIVDFSANINPLGLPLAIKKALSSNVDGALHYPQPWAERLVKKISEYFGVNKNNVLVANGSTELIYLVMRLYRPKTTLIPVPTFTEYERAASSVRSKVRFINIHEGENFKLPLSMLEKNRADALFLCNPNNPTGNLLYDSPKYIKRLRHGLIVVDEAFMDFLPTQNEHTIMREALKNKRIVAIRTLTKFFALPGLRIGYIVAHKDTIAKLKACLPPWNINFFAQLAAELILINNGYIKKTYTIMQKERSFLFSQLNSIRGMRPYPSVANFILIRLTHRWPPSHRLKGLLLKKRILVRDCSNFRNLSNRFIRVAVRSHKENLGLLRALKEVS